MLGTVLGLMADLPDERGVTASELSAVAGASGGPDDLAGVTTESLYGQGVASATAGIWRYSVGPWSAVLKLLRHGREGSPAWRSGEELDHWYYWRREADAMASGWLAGLTSPLRPPRCYGAFDRVDGSVGLWIEDLTRMPAAASWDVSRYGRAAHQLGRAQGVMATSALDQPWLARDWLRQYVERHGDAVAQLDDTPRWHDPLVTELLPTEARAECRAIWDAREELLARLESLPPTLTHSDLHPGNLFGTDTETVVIDWSFAGRGPLGEDPGNLVFDAVWDHFVSPDDFPALNQTVRTGYTDGLSDTHCPVDPELISKAISAAAAVKFFWIPPVMAGAAASGAELLNRRPLEETFRRWAAVVPELFEARRHALAP